MAIEIFRPDVILRQVAKNPLRRYPGAQAGARRLLPYAQPQLSTDLRIPAEASFFVAGNCFARNIEKALRRSGVPVLSSPVDMGLPGSAQEQFNRYNIFNLDVNHNEFRWALRPDLYDIDDALIEVEGEWIDMQIHFNFAHPEAQARHYRAVYNATYEPVAKADVIVLSPLGREQWFDREKGIYLNGMPSAGMTQLYPGRFEFHRLDLDALTASMRDCCVFLREHSQKDPVILLAPAPVWQAMTHVRHDTLIDQMEVKSMQRIAAQRVADELDRVEYIASLEFGLESDFRFSYTPASPNHTTQCLSDRMMAEVLLRYQGPSQQQKLMHALGHCAALNLDDRGAEAREVAEAAFAEGVPSHIELDFLYARALVMAGEKQMALRFLLERIEGYDPDLSDTRHRFDFAANLAAGAGEDADFDALVALSRRLGLPYERPLRAPPRIATSAAIVRNGELQAAFALLRAGDAAGALAYCEENFPAAADWSLAERERLQTLHAQACMRMDRNKDALAHMLASFESGEIKSPALFELATNIARSAGTLEDIDTLLMIGEMTDQHDAVIERLSDRKDALTRRRTAS